MAGHSKFKNIMHKKGAADKKRAQLFTRLAREVQIAAKAGGADPHANPRLRLAIQNARAENMPKDNVQRAIDKAIGGGGENLEEVRYEGFGPGGVGVLVEALTDNRNRTAAAVRTAFGKNGGALGESNSVAFGFDRVGEIRYPRAKAGEEAMMEAAIEAGAADALVEEDSHVVLCAVSDLAAVAAALENRFGEASASKIIWRPQTMIDIAGEEADALLGLLDALDDLDDVQTVTANYTLSAAEAERLGLATG